MNLQTSILKNLDIDYSYQLAKRMEQFRTNPVLGYRPAGSRAEFETGERLKKEMDIPVMMTYGYITKYWREKVGLEKSHINDAVCISKHPYARLLDTYYLTKAVRHHNRQIHKTNFSKGGIRKRNQTPYLVKGFCLFDKVLYQGKSYFIFGRRATGFFDIRTLDGVKVNKGSVSYKKLRIQDTAKAYLKEVRAIPHMNKFTCVLA